MKLIPALLILLATALVILEPAQAASFDAGVARACITPPMPFWLTGYAARTNPAPKVRSDLWAKALALRDARGQRAVIVTTDIIGLPAELSDAVARRLEEEHGLRRSDALFNSSHTHAGPVVWPNLKVMFDLDPSEQARALDYTRQLTRTLVEVAGRALDQLRPARLAAGVGSAGFAMNRRQPVGSAVRIGENPVGPVDHSVPVIEVTTPDGGLLAVLFGYACHNTTLGGNFYEIDGDYAGAAQREIEKAHPGATAMFLMLCGGDQNPRPRGTYDHVTSHGHQLAAAVERVLGGTLTPLPPRLRSAWHAATLEFAPHDRARFETEAAGTHVFQQRRARLMLEAYDRGQPIRTLEYPVQALRLGDTFTLLALGGEVCIDYVHRARHQYPGEMLAVAGYCNDVSCYIPSRRVLDEGGYEPADSMIYYAQPGPLRDTVEETVFGAIDRVLAQVGVQR
ncbi:MAG TPA: neutral/alkaline non-lysosomal ceramidase N-terminal domain-containing protein [Verrucomicrobiota bacterium]|nr:neutral/alkaline non-lysosomal ceramidase N-terminal domain-containing protein [Verrucomicrobiota bacterium]HNU50980.1 neutral/alkaline non-lysosomal ceramidase N-terminal domain-containing protein [Verrucomicrobiota bacterium]